jgi:hypothetical protein
MPFFEFTYPNIHLCFYGVTQTKLCKSIHTKISIPKMLTGWEHFVLARFAVYGEIVALPAVLRKYRSHSSGEYLTEVAEIERMSNWRRIVFVYGNRFKLRMNLLKVLLGAPFTWKSNFRILRRLMILDLQWWRWEDNRWFYRSENHIRRGAALWRDGCPGCAILRILFSVERKGLLRTFLSRQTLRTYFRQGQRGRGQEKRCSLRW